MSPRQWIVNVNEVNEWACERSSERVIEPAIEGAIERSIEQASVRASDRAIDWASVWAIERSGERSNDRASARSSDRTIERVSDRAIEGSSVHAYTRIHAYTRVYTCIQVYAHVYTRIHAYTLVHTRTHTYTCVESKTSRNKLRQKKTWRKTRLWYHPRNTCSKSSKESGFIIDSKFLVGRKEPTRVSGFVLIRLGSRGMIFFRKLIKLVPPRRRGITKGSLRDYYALRNLSFYRIITSRESANPLGISEAILYAPTVFRLELFQHWLYSQRWIQQPVGHSRLTDSPTLKEEEKEEEEETRCWQLLSLKPDTPISIGRLRPPNPLLCCGASPPRPPSKFHGTWAMWDMIHARWP